jgi:hypothetical protein
MIRRIVLAALVALFLPVAAFAQAPGAKPLIVLLEANPWLMAIGSDSPSFALYDDGTAIYVTETGYKSVKLDAAECDALVASVNPGALAGVAGRYDIARGVSDQPTEYLFVYGAGAPKVISVYGSLAGGNAGSAPAPIGAAYKILRGFSRPDAKDWLPERIEVMIWPYEYAPEASIDWPQDWPGLDDPTTVKRGKDSYSLYLPSADYPALNAFLETRKEKGAVRIGGHKWTASIRFPFPQEATWMSLRGYEPV